MYTTLLALLSLCAVALNVAGQGQTMPCQTYAAIGEKGFTCNDLPDIICQEGCNAFVTATNCAFPSHPKKPQTTELCTVGFGRNTAAAKACITGQGTFRCTGTFSGLATCHGCVKSDQIKWID